MHRFDEHHSEFAGFSRHFEAALAPGLRQADGAREVAVKRGQRNGVIAAASMVAVAGAVFVFIGSLDIVFFLLLGAGVLGFALYAHAIKDVVAATKGSLVGGVFGYVGWTLTAEVETFDITPWEQAFLLPNGINKFEFEDRIHGPAHGAIFQSVEAVLKRKARQTRSEKSDKTLFQGQLMWITLPKPLGEGRTVVLRDKGWANRKTKSDMKRVGLADPVFEKIFEAYSTDQVGARVVLDPVFMQRLVDLEAAVSGKNIRFAFSGTTVLIAVETPNLFEAGSMRQKLDAPERAQRVLDEVGSVLDVVDRLMGRA